MVWNADYHDLADWRRSAEIMKIMVIRVPYYLIGYLPKGINYLFLKQKTMILKQGKLILSFLFLFNFCAFAQQPITFFKTYDGGSEGCSVIQTSDEGFVCTGRSDSRDLLFLKTDKFGVVEHFKEFGSPHFDIGQCIKKTLDGGYIIAGEYGEPDFLLEGHSSIFILKTNSSGDSLWSFVKNVGVADVAYSVVEAKDSSYLFTGFINGGFGSGTAYISKLDKSGREIWNKSFQSESYTNTIIEVKEGGYVLWGGHNGTSKLVRINENGDTIWAKDLNLDLIGLGEIIQAKDSSLVIVGTTHDNPQKLLVAKIDKAQEVVWIKQYGGNDDDRGFSIDQTRDGGFIVTGETNSFSTGQFRNTEIWLLRLNNEGDTLWTRTFGEERNEVGKSVKSCKDGGYIVTGSLQDRNELFLLKTDSLGNVLAPSNTDNLKSSPITLGKIYPNPFSKNEDESLTYELSTHVDEEMFFEIIDQNGQVISRQKLLTGQKKHKVLPPFKNSGIYFFRVISFESKVLQSGEIIISQF